MPEVYPACALPINAIGVTGCVELARVDWRGEDRKDEVKDFVAEYGQVIVDECHHISAFTFEQVMKQVKARYVVGLTATPTRKDGHHPIIYMQCGPIPLQHERADDDRNHALRAQGDPAAHRFPDAGRDGRPDDSGCLCRVGQGFGTKHVDLRRPEECPGSRPVAAIAHGTERAS